MFLIDFFFTLFVRAGWNRFDIPNAADNSLYYWLDATTTCLTWPNNGNKLPFYWCYLIWFWIFPNFHSHRHHHLHGMHKRDLGSMHHWLVFHRPLWKFNYNLLFVRKYFEHGDHEFVVGRCLKCPIQKATVCNYVENARSRSIQQWLFTFPLLIALQKIELRQKPFSNVNCLCWHCTKNEHASNHID